MGRCTPELNLREKGENPALLNSCYPASDVWGPFSSGWLVKLLPHHHYVSMILEDGRLPFIEHLASGKAPPEEARSLTFMYPHPFPPNLLIYSLAGLRAWESQARAKHSTKCDHDPRGIWAASRSPYTPYLNAGPVGIRVYKAGASWKWNKSLKSTIETTFKAFSLRTVS